MDFLYLVLITAFVFVSALLVYGFEKLRPAPPASKAQAGKTGSPT